jgi:L-ascorbate metabolism protein UlaG (beta-lactamase superfamily)
MLHLQYFGQAFFKIWNEDIAIVMDPFTDIGYPMPEHVEADVVSISHSHYDHNNPKLVRNAQLIIHEPGEYTF